MDRAEGTRPGGLPQVVQALKYALAVGTIGVLVVGLGGILLCRYLNPIDVEGRAQLLTLMATLNRDSTPTAVRSAVVARHRLRVFQQGGDATAPILVVASGNQCDAKNWLLILEYDKGALRRATIGTQDSWAEHPEHAPQALTF